jgi:hypothetical protein
MTYSWALFAGRDPAFLTCWFVNPQTLFVASGLLRNEGLKVNYNHRLQNKRAKPSSENFGKVVAFAPLTSAEEP